MLSGAIALMGESNRTHRILNQQNRETASEENLKSALRRSPPCPERIPEGSDRGWSQEWELYLGAIDGKFRYIDTDGNVIPTREEDNLAVRSRAEQYRQQLEQADRARAEAVVRLLALGVTVEQVAASFALSPEEIRAIATRNDESN